jgi:hypothetical protein
MAQTLSEKYQSQLHRPQEHISRYSRSNESDVFAQAVVAESHTRTFSRRIPTPSYPHFLNTRQVSSYQNWTAATRSSPDSTWVSRSEDVRWGEASRSRWPGDDHLPIQRSKSASVLMIFHSMRKMGGGTLVLRTWRGFLPSAAVRTPVSVWRINNGPQAPRLTLLLMTTPQFLKVRENYSVTTCIVQPTRLIRKTAVAIHQQSLQLCSSSLCVWCEPY